MHFECYPHTQNGDPKDGPLLVQNNEPPDQWTPIENWINYGLHICALKIVISSDKLS